MDPGRLEPRRAVEVFADARAKLQRARKHLSIMDDHVRAYFESRPYHVFHEYDPYDPAGYLIRGLTFTKEPPDDIALAFGDAIHCLRATLDYVLYCAVVANGHEPPRWMQFPIVLDPRSWDERRGPNRTIRQWHLPNGMAAVVEGLQPWDRGQPQPDHPLWGLHELSDIEKHRRVHLTSVWLAGSEHLDFFGPEAYRVFRGVGPKKGQTVWRTFSFPQPVPSDTDMNVYLQGSLHVVLDEEGDLRGAPIGPLIRRLAEYIEDVALERLAEIYRHRSGPPPN